MNRIGFVFAACMALSAPALANAPPPQVTARDMAGDVVAAFMENFNAGNKEGMASTYSDGGNFVWAENGRVVSTDKASAVAALDKMPAGVRIETDNTMQVIMIGSAAAEAIVPFTYFMKDDKGAEAEIFKGVMTMTVAPDSDGAWRIVAGHMSSSGRE
jgi:hypothetical protein